jgi:hypothetical protein
VITGEIEAEDSTFSERWWQLQEAEIKREALDEIPSWLTIDYIFALVKGNIFLAHLILVRRRAILEKTEKKFISR